MGSLEGNNFGGITKSQHASINHPQDMIDAILTDNIEINSPVSSEYTTFSDATASSTFVDFLIEDLEDGNSVLSWASAVIDTGSVMNGTNCLDFTSSNNALLEYASFSENPKDDEDFEWKVLIGADTATAGDCVQHFFQDTNGNDTIGIKFNDNGGNVEEIWSGTQLLASWSANTIYHIEVIHDYTNSTVDIYIDGTLVGNDIAFNNAGTVPTRFNWLNITSNSGNTRTTYMDEYSYRRENFGIYSSNDDLTSYWQPNPANETNAYVSLDAGSTKLLGGIRLNFQNSAYTPNELTIEDGSGNIIDTMNPNTGWNEMTHRVGLQRYYKVIVSDYGTADGIRVHDSDFYSKTTDKVLEEHGHKMV